MNLTPWKRKEAEGSSAVTPWLFRREFDDLVDRFFVGEPMVSRGIFGRTFSPVLDLGENENEIIVKAEIPGMDQKDLDISLSGNVLTIKGEKKAESEEKGENFHLVERSYGAFSRSLVLPCEVQQDKVDASYEDGVLSLKIPKSEKCKTKTVKIAVH